MHSPLPPGPQPGWRPKAERSNAEGQRPKARGQRQEAEGCRPMAGGQRLEAESQRPEAERPRLEPAEKHIIFTFLIITLRSVLRLS